MKFTNITNMVNILTITIGKQYLYDIANTYLHGHDMDVVSDIMTSIDHVVSEGYGVGGGVAKFKLPREISNFLKKDNNISELGHDMDKYIVFRDQWDTTYDFFEPLLNYMKQAYGWYKEDRKTGKMHLYFKFAPTQPSDYEGLDDMRADFNSIMAKFYLSKYDKYSTHTKTSKEGCAYCITLFYLYIIGSLYRILRPFIDGDIYGFMKTCLLILNPVITGMTITSQYNTGDLSAISVISELQQLKAKNNRLTISSNKSDYSIKFSYAPKGMRFKNKSNDDDTNTRFRTDRNGKRRVEVLVTGEGNTITIRTDLIGMDLIHDMTGLAGNKDLLSISSNESLLEYITSQVIRTILEHTHQYYWAKRFADSDVEGEFDEDFRILTDDGSDPEYTEQVKQEQKEILKDEKLKQKVFIGVKGNTSLPIAEILIKEFNLNKYSIDYIIIAIELAKKDDNYISRKLNDCGIASKQQALIRKMIARVRSLKTTRINSLNYIYNKLEY